MMSWIGVQPVASPLELRAHDDASRSTIVGPNCQTDLAF